VVEIFYLSLTLLVPVLALNYKQKILSLAKVGKGMLLISLLNLFGWRGA
jgi:hypothetical protein